MERIKPGVYTAKPDSECTPKELEKRISLIGRLRTKASAMARESAERRYNAQQAIYAIRDARKIRPDEGYYIWK